MRHQQLPYSCRSVRDILLDHYVEMKRLCVPRDDEFLWRPALETDVLAKTNDNGTER